MKYPRQTEMERASAGALKRQPTVTAGRRGKPAFLDRGFQGDLI